ncbi:MAG TPA: nuclear transport factor 2 family protein [Candidatus Dormibacteraeota bacterium]|nr:nuclear transport factor 2 family protein [Candidatus Dormibacteraeota bacterium]
MSVSALTPVEAVTAFFDAYRAHDVERMVELCSENADFHYVPFEVWTRQRVIRGDGKVRTIGKAFWTTLIDSFPDLTNRVTSITADDRGNVAVEVVISGTQAKTFGAISNQGRRYDLPHLFRFRVSPEGQIEEITAYWDSADWYRQLGHLEVD